MKNTTEEDEDIIADINMTPLIDIMLVLLIIFMVSSSVSLESGIDINLPNSASKSAKTSSAAVLVSIRKDGEVFINSKITSLENFKDSLAKIMASEKSFTVIIEGDEQSNLGMTVKLMDLAKEAGAEKFAIATEVAN